MSGTLSSPDVLPAGGLVRRSGRLFSVVSYKYQYFEVRVCGVRCVVCRLAPGSLGPHAPARALEVSPSRTREPWVAQGPRSAARQAARTIELAPAAPPGAAGRSGRPDTDTGRNRKGHVRTCHHASFWPLSLSSRAVCVPPVVHQPVYVRGAAAPRRTRGARGEKSTVGRGRGGQPPRRWRSAGRWRGGACVRTCVRACVRLRAAPRRAGPRRAHAAARAGARR